MQRFAGLFGFGTAFANVLAWQFRNKIHRSKNHEKRKIR